MIVLAVHTTTPVLGVACVEDDSVLGEIALPPGRQHLENLTRTIKDLTDRLTIGLAEVDGFGVAIVRVVFRDANRAREREGNGSGAWEACRRDLVPRHPRVARPGRGRNGSLDHRDAKRGATLCASYKKIGGGLSLLDGPMLMLADEFARPLTRLQCRILVSADASLEGLGGSCCRSAARIPIRSGVCFLGSAASQRRRRKRDSFTSSAVHTSIPMRRRKEEVLLRTYFMNSVM